MTEVEWICAMNNTSPMSEGNPKCNWVGNLEKPKAAKCDLLPTIVDLFSNGGNDDFGNSPKFHLRLNCCLFVFFYTIFSTHVADDPQTILGLGKPTYLPTSRVLFAFRIHNRARERKSTSWHNQADRWAGIGSNRADLLSKHFHCQVSRRRRRSSLYGLENPWL